MLSFAINSDIDIHAFNGVMSDPSLMTGNVMSPTDDEQRERNRRYQAEWYQRNKAKKNAQSVAWGRENIARRREITRESERKRRHAKAIAEGRDPFRVGRPLKYTAEEQRAKRLEKAKRWYHTASPELVAAYKEKARLREQAKRDGTFVSSQAKRKLSREEKLLRGRQDSQKRRAFISGNGGTWTKADIKRILEEQQGLCAICNKPFGDDGFHIDHWKPLSKGGTNYPENLKLTHPACNLRKGANLPDELNLLPLPEGT